MSDVTLTDAEAAEVDWFMSEHMYRHTISNSPNSWSCDVGCRTRALGRALSPVLAARLSQEREQVRADRDREWRAAVKMLAAQLERPLDGMRQRASTNADFAEIAAMEHTKRSSAQALRRLAQDGPRPAQEGER